MVFDHAIGRSIIAANPCTGVKLHAIKGPATSVRQRLMLTEDELQRLLPSSSSARRMHTPSSS